MIEEPDATGGEDIATIVLRKTDVEVRVSFADTLASRARHLERIRDRIVLPRLEKESAPAIREGDETDGALLLPAVGCLITPLSRLRPEFQKDNDEFWVVVNVDVGGASPVPPHLSGIGIPQACRGGASQLVGVIDSGVSAAESDATIFRYAKVDRYGHKTEPTVLKDFHHDQSAAPSGGWYHGSQVCNRIAGVTDGVAPQAKLAVVAALTALHPDKRPKGWFHQFVVGLSWLLTTQFRPAPAPLGCDVINASLSVNANTANQREALKAVIDLASAAQVLIVCAVGADANPAGVLVGPLALNAATLAVGALDAYLPSFSNTNLYDVAATKPEICAPGPSTSMATPVVTGACALLLEAQPALRNNAADLKKTLLKDLSATPVASAPQGLNTCQLSLANFCGGS